MAKVALCRKALIIILVSFLFTAGSLTVAAQSATTLHVTAPAQVTLGAKTTVTGTLAANGMGVSNAPVVLYRYSSTQWDTVANGLTDSAGSFSVSFTENTSAGTTVQYIVAYNGNETYNGATSDLVAVTYVATPMQLTVNVSPQTAYVGQNVTFSGRLTADGRGLPGEPIEIFLATGVFTNDVYWYRATTFTDASGYFTHSLTETNASSGKYQVSFEGNGSYAPVSSAPVYVVWNLLRPSITTSATPSQLYVGQTALVAGNLTVNGEPVSGKNVALFRSNYPQYTELANATTNATGFVAFQVTESIAGTYRYVLTDNGDATYAAAIAGVSVTYVTTPTNITANATPQQQYVGKNVTITGRLTANGTGLPGAPVSIYRSASPLRVYVGNSTTNATGYYTFTFSESAIGNSSTSHSFYYLARYQGDAAHVAASSGLVKFTFLQIPTSTTASASKSTQYVGEATIISGRLTANGQGLAGLQVNLYALYDTTLVNIGNATTNASGYYSLTFTASRWAANPATASWTNNVIGYKAAYLGNATYGLSQSVYTTVDYRLLTFDMWNIEVNPQLPYVGQNATISGKLVANGTGLGGQKLTLYELLPNGLIAEAGQTTTTDTTGFYSFNVTQSAQGRYQYVVGYLGEGTYTRDNAVVYITFQTLPTVLTASVNTTEQTVGHSILVSGTLTSGAGISGKPVTLYNYDGNRWISNASIKTDESGRFSFLITQSTSGEFDYRVGYAGDNTYTAATSTTLSVFFS